MRWEKEKILNSDYSFIIKDLNRLIKETDNIFSWELENRPLIAARENNE